jgi:hypothetical protein
MRTKGLMASALAGAILLCITMVAPSWAASIPCTGPLGAVEIKGNISAGAGCDLSGTTVRGNVIIEPGGSLSNNFGSTTVITGNLESSKATQIIMEGTTSVGGGLQLDDTTDGSLFRSEKVGRNVEIKGGTASISLTEGDIGGNVQIQNTSGSAFGESGLINIAVVNVGGNVQVANNSLAGSFLTEVSIFDSSVAGNLQLSNNSAMGGFLTDAVFVEFNRVGGSAELSHNAAGLFISVSGNEVTTNLNCTGNKPPPIDLEEPNTAKKKLGQCELL